MSGDRDDEMTDEPTDELLQRVVAELRRPVRIDPEVDARVLRAIAAPAPVVRPGRRSWIVGAAGVGLAASVLLAVALGSRNTRPVELRLAAPRSSHVAVVGDFNDWDPARTPLRQHDGEWTVELRLKPGRYRYTFLIDGERWTPDPSEPRAVNSDFDAPTSVLTVS